MQCAESVETAASQIVSYNNICHGIEYKLDVICICGTCLVTVNLFCRAFVLGLELCLDVRCCFLVGLLSWNTVIGLLVKMCIKKPLVYTREAPYRRDKKWSHRC